MKQKLIVNGWMIGNTDNIFKSAVVVDDYKVYYKFQKKNDSDISYFVRDSLMLMLMIKLMLWLGWVTPSVGLAMIDV